jgi:mannose-6-phosphate isomerase-like protein (cupin superfamily)
VTDQGDLVAFARSGVHQIAFRPTPSLFDVFGRRLPERKLPSSCSLTGPLSSVHCVFRSCTLVGLADDNLTKDLMIMKMLLRVLAAAILVVPVIAADPPGFAMWKSAELKQRDAALSKKVGPDHSARETLADYGDHRFRMLYRDADGVPEQHDNIVDVVIVQSGEGTLLVGGRMINPKAGGSAGEYLGTGIEGGERHPLGPGDIVHIPAKAPHSFLVPKGGHITYVLVKFPAP